MNDPSLPIIIFGVLSSGSVLGFFGILVNGFFQRRKLKGEVQRLGAESIEVVTKTSISLLAPMKEELKEVRAELKTTRSDLAELRSQLRRLLIELSDYRELTPGESKIVDGY